MSRLRWAKPSPALLVAVTALFAALTGTAVGGVVVGKLNGKERNQVTKIAKKLDKKIELLPGPKGDMGPPGPKGESGATNVTVRTSNQTIVGPGGVGSAQATCEPGEHAVGGGGGFGQPFDDIDLDRTVQSIPHWGADPDPTGWNVRMKNGDASNARGLTATVVCISP
jgi:hypothetical protein